MCGRYAVFSTNGQIAARFHLNAPDTDTPNEQFNAAPTQHLPVITLLSHTIEYFRWGLIPSWAKELSIGNKLINARAETLVEKPSFRTAFRKRRCLVVCDGFYEWHKTPSGKVPMFIHLASGELFGIAGLWEQWHNPETDELLKSFTIITTEPNELMSEIHNRMPAIVRQEEEGLWLAPTTHEQELQHILRPFPAEEMEAWPVSTAVNNPRNNSPLLLERMDD